MKDRLEIAAHALEGILIGSFTERPNARPSPARVAQMALAYADALLEEDVKTPSPIKPAA